MNYLDEFEVSFSEHQTIEAVASTYYSTTREEVGVEHEDINTEYILSLYRALMEKYPDNVQEKEYKSTDGSFTNYAYEISTGEYPTGTYGTVHIKDEQIKKPKYLILSAIDGDERKTALSTYRFIRDVLSGHNVPKYFKEDVIISVMPVGVPYAFDKFERYNENGVYIDRNFAAEWTPTTATGVNPGTSAASEKETQAISKWISDNSDADLYLDVHNNGAVHELVTVIGAPNNATTDTAKKIAMRGIGKIVPYWRDVIGYSSFISTDGEYKDTDGDGDKEFVLKDMDVIFVNSASMATNGQSITFAQKVHGIPSLLLELATYDGDCTEWEKNQKAYPAETIAMGAEAIGNILIEFYEQNSEVISMNEVNEKLDAILQSAAFRVVKGTYTPSANESTVTISDIPANAKTVEIRAVSTVSEGTMKAAPVSLAVFRAIPVDGNLVGIAENMWVEYHAFGQWASSTIPATNDEGLSFTMDTPLVFEGGKTYEWTAYCWD